MLDTGVGLKPHDFGLGVRGASAVLNSAIFYTCPICAACVVELDPVSARRQGHIDWHQALALEATGWSAHTERRDES